MIDFVYLLIQTAPYFLLRFCCFNVSKIDIKMSHVIENGSVEGFIDMNDEPIEHGVARTILLLSMVGNIVFHITSTMLHLIQMNKAIWRVRK